MNTSKLFFILVAIALSNVLSAQSILTKPKSFKSKLPAVLRGINEAFSHESRTGRPIVVVHGFGAHYQEIHDFIRPIDRATHYKRPIYSAPYQESLTSFPFNSLKTLSRRFGKFVQVLLDHKLINNKSGFDIVGISLGGLVARLYIQNSIKYQHHPRVRNFVTLGSPHHGVDIRALRSMVEANTRSKKVQEQIKRTAWNAAVMMTKTVSPFVRSISWGNKNIAPLNSTLTSLDFISTLVFGQDSLVTPISTQRIQIDGEFSCLVQSDHLAYASDGLPSLDSFLDHALAETEAERSSRESMNDAWMRLGNMDCFYSYVSTDEDSGSLSGEGSGFLAGAEDSGSLSDEGSGFLADDEDSDSLIDQAYASFGDEAYASFADEDYILSTNAENGSVTNEEYGSSTDEKYGSFTDEEEYYSFPDEDNGSLSDQDYYSFSD